MKLIKKHKIKDINLYNNINLEFSIKKSERLFKKYEESSPIVSAAVLGGAIKHRINKILKDHC